MSYILDALKKSQRERDLGSIPTIQSMDHVESNAHSQRPLWLIGGTIGVATLALAYALFTPEQKVAVAPQPSVVTLTQEQRESTALNGQKVVAEQQTVAVPTPLPEETVLQELAVEDVATPPPEIKLSTTAPAPSAAESTVAGQDEEYIPLLKEIEYKFAGSAPRLHIDVHVYSAKATERFVLINMQRYREGENTANGAKLEAITSEGVIMRYNGVRFRLERS